VGRARVALGEGIVSLYGPGFWADVGLGVLSLGATIAVVCLTRRFGNWTMSLRDPIPFLVEGKLWLQADPKGRKRIELTIANPGDVPFFVTELSVVTNERRISGVFSVSLEPEGRANDPRKLIPARGAAYVRIVAGLREGERVRDFVMERHRMSGRKQTFSLGPVTEKRIDSRKCEFRRVAQKERHICQMIPQFIRRQLTQSGKRK